MSRSSCAFKMALQAGLLSAIALGAADPVGAQAKLEAHYTASLAGIPLGKGSWIIDIGDDKFSAAASGMTTGLVRVFAAGEGSGASQGAIAGNQFQPASYAASIMAGKKADQVQMTLQGGNVREFNVTPPQPEAPDRIPVTEAHRRGVSDPMTASLARAPAQGEVLSPEICQRQIAIFDGRLRYDLNFSFKRLDRVKAEKGYEGPVLVCAVYFVPVAGHLPDRVAIKYLAKLRDMEVWLAPMAGTRVLVPFRFSVPTPVGLGVLEASHFVSVAQPTKASVRTP